MTNSQDYRKYLETRFDDLTTLMNARFNIVDEDNKETNTHLRDLNGSIAEHAKAISDLQIRNELHITECPAMPKIELLEKEIIGPWIRKHWKMAIFITIVSLFIAYSMFELFSIKELISMVK